MRFEQDVGLQTDDNSSQDLSNQTTQTDPDAWLRTWIQEITEQLNLIDKDVITDTQALITLLEDLHNIQEEIDSHLQHNSNQSSCNESLEALNLLLAAKRAMLLSTTHWKSLVDEVISNGDEFKIFQLLEIIPQGAPFSKKLKEALNNLQQPRLQSNPEEETEVIIPYNK